MKDEDKTKEHLIQELVELRQRVAELEATEMKRKQMSEEREAEKSKVDSIVNSITSGIDIVSYKFRIQYQNKFLLDRFGDIRGKLCYKEYMNRDRPCSDCPMRRAIENNRAERTELIAADGQNYEVLSTPMQNPDGTMSAVEVVLDITERKRVEEMAQTGEERYRTLFEESRDAIYVSTRDGKVVDINRSFLDLFGYSRKEIAGLNVRKSYVDLADRLTFQQEIEQNGFVRDYELKLRKKDGTEMDCLVTSSVRKDADGDVLGYQGIIRDITEHKLAEEALRESKERFRTLTESTSDWIWEVDVNGVYTYASPKVKDLLGYEPEEVIGKTAFDLMPLDEAERVGAIFRYIVASQRSFERLENVNLHKDGGRVVLETSGVPVIHANGSLLGYRGIDRDITERERAEEALRKREAELEITTNCLEEVNTALRVLLNRRDEDKTELEEKVLVNVKQLVVPYLERLKKSPLDPRQLAYLHILESNLNAIISPFIRTLSAKYVSLTPTEIQVANLIKEGKNTKETGDVMRLSPRTIETHRKNIRKKLGIEKKKGNLRTHLMAFQ